MAKTQTRYVCQECGRSAHKWMGRCPDCGSWNSFVEEKRSEKKTRTPEDVAGGRSEDGEARPRPLSEIDMGPETRIKSGLQEFDRVMGGGLMQGSVNLIAGDPGIGKSTLMTQLGRHLPERTILYVTGEESVRQVKARAERLDVDSDRLLLFAETNTEEIVAASREKEPDLLIVDSIQTVFRPDIESAPGSVSQVRESASALARWSKQNNVPAFLVGHVTKKGSIAGPRVLEHMVDTVLYFEGDRHHAYRILRARKNRFGSANEIGVFEMRDDGLREVANPSEIFLSERSYGVSGSTVICALEGTRPVLVEIQALVTPASYGTPQRTATGLEQSRLRMLLGVLEKREGLQLTDHDVFLNVAGGIRLDEPAVDLGAAVAVASSFRDIPADTTTALVGEVGLGGEVRSVTQIALRLKEAAKLGFERALVPEGSLDGLTPPEDLEVKGVRRLREALEAVL
jgi:DNA repair protein RadA/Sms